MCFGFFCGVIPFLPSRKPARTSGKPIWGFPQETYRPARTPVSLFLRGQVLQILGEFSQFDFAVQHVKDRWGWILFSSLLFLGGGPPLPLLKTKFVCCSLVGFKGKSFTGSHLLLARGIKPLEAQNDCFYVCGFPLQPLQPPRPGGSGVRPKDAARSPKNWGNSGAAPFGATRPPVVMP